MSRDFELVSPYKPSGDQPKVIEAILKGFDEGMKQQVLLGVTGSGKTFSMANVIAKMNRPTLVISHNKTLAAQLASEFKIFFPQNAVEYFVSYYDYYQPEAYVPHTDTYIEKDSSINEKINRLRHATTSSLMSRRDVIIVASVSCIYGLGSPEDYKNLCVVLEEGQEYPRKQLIKDLLRIRYERNDIAFERGEMRVRGDVIDIFPAYEEQKAIRIELFGDEIESIRWMDPLSGNTLNTVKREIVFPASHYVIPEEKMKVAIKTIRAELDIRLADLEEEDKLLEYQRLKMRTNYDIEMMKELGYCSGIENYSRHFSNRKVGEKPFVLLDFFDDDFLIFIDESHASIPQIRGMYEGDKARKTNLVEHAFRLPSALDNRPLEFKEFEQYLNNVVYVSATPAEYEIRNAEQIVQQIIRPTGIMDPEIEIRALGTQVDDLLAEIQVQVKRKERTLVTTLTKKMSEDLTKYMKDLNIAVKYLHSDILTLERLTILKALLSGEVDVVVGVNLLREGLDLPEVSLVAILDADKEGFLRNERSLIQTMGRAARNVNGRVILYADKMTKSIISAVKETERRRKIQREYNEENGIIPRSIQKIVYDLVDTSDLLTEERADILDPLAYKTSRSQSKNLLHEDSQKLIIDFEKEMREAAEKLEFEKAAQIRDKIRDLS
jgi:excinuclease ABC subunit B